MLPWLQIKFALASVLIMAAVGLKLLLSYRDWRSCVAMAMVFALSGFLLLGYNHHAFVMLWGLTPPVR